MTRGYTKRDDPVAHAWSGDFERLARHIENGGEVDDEMRAVLVAILRKELRFPRGIRRGFAQIQTDRDAALYIRQAKMAGLPRSKAIESWLDANPNMSAATLKKMLQRAARDRNQRKGEGSLLGIIKSAFSSPD